MFEDLPLRTDKESSSAEVDLGQLETRPPQVTASEAKRPPAKPVTPQIDKLPLFPESDDPGKSPATPPPKPVTRTISRPGAGAIVPTGARLAAAAIDFGVVLMVLVVTTMGLRWIGVKLDAGSIAPMLFYLLAFSFLYFVFPLAFWGRTPGMAQLGLAARCSNGDTLTFSQSAQRWLGAVLTVAGLGLPLLVMTSTGSSLGDRLSHSNVNPCNR